MVGRDPDCDCIVLGPFLSEGTTSRHRARLYGPDLMNLIVPVYHDITNIVAMAEVVVFIVRCDCEACTNIGAR